MRYYFLGIGLCGIPFTSGWSFILGLLMFGFMSIGQAEYRSSIQQIKSSPTPIHAIGNGCYGLIVTLGIGVVFITAMLIVAAMMESSQ